MNFMCEDSDEYASIDHSFESAETMSRHTIFEHSIDYDLMQASKRGNLNAIKSLVASGVNIHIINDYALRWASRNGHLELVKYLIQLGAKVEAHDNYAARWASRNGHLDVVKYLILAGAYL